MAHQEEHFDDQAGFMAHHEGLVAISCHEGYRAQQVGHNGISGEVYTSRHTPPVPPLRRIGLVGMLRVGP